MSTSGGESGGGGITPSNWYAVANNGIVLAAGQTTVPMIFNADEGGAYAVLNADTITVDVLVGGIFVITTVFVVDVVGVAASPTIDVTSVLTFTTADAFSLAESFSVNGNLWGATVLADQSRNSTLQIPFTTPPMALAEGDSFQWLAGLSAAPAAGVTLISGAAISGLVIVKVG